MEDVLKRWGYSSSKEKQYIMQLFNDPIIRNQEYIPTFKEPRERNDIWYHNVSKMIILMHQKRDFFLYEEDGGTLYRFFHYEKSSNVSLISTLKDIIERIFYSPTLHKIGGMLMYRFNNLQNFNDLFYLFRRTEGNPSNMKYYIFDETFLMFSEESVNSPAKAIYEILRELIRITFPFYQNFTKSFFKKLREVILEFSKEKGYSPSEILENMEIDEDYEPFSKMEISYAIYNNWFPEKKNFLLDLKYFDSLPFAKIVKSITEYIKEKEEFILDLYYKENEKYILESSYYIEKTRYSIFHYLIKEVIQKIYFNATINEKLKKLYPSFEDFQNHILIKYQISNTYTSALCFFSLNMILLDGFRDDFTFKKLLTTLLHELAHLIYGIHAHGKRFSKLFLYLCKVYYRETPIQDLESFLLNMQKDLKENSGIKKSLFWFYSQFKNLKN